MRKLCFLVATAIAAAGPACTCSPPSPNLQNCNGAMVDILTSLTDCGSCGNACLSVQTCQNGTCVLTSGAGPDAGPATVCQACTTGADCGGGNNLCLTDENGYAGCGLDCGSGEPCPAGTTCQTVHEANGSAVKNCFPASGVCNAGAQCKDACTSGATQCSPDGSGVETCDLQANGCYGWTPSAACAVGQSCSNGQCGNGCTDGCLTSGATRCTADYSGVETCQTQANGCLGWSAGVACGAGETCSGGFCSTSCPYACIQNTTQCAADGSGVQTCVEQANGCYEWSSGVACAAGQSCSGGQCVTGCTNACTAATTQCAADGSGVQTCGLQASGCYGWSSGVACAAGQSCSGGKCVAGSSVPNAPASVTAVAGNQQATVSWAAPSKDGGSAITSYTVTSYPSAKTVTVSAPTLSATVTGLVNGTAYHFTVYATNANGNGPPASSNTVTPTSACAASAPVLTGGPGPSFTAKLSWTADPSCTTFNVYWTTTPPVTTGSTAVTGAASPYTQVSLTPDTTYSFAVAAVEGGTPDQLSNAVTFKTPISCSPSGWCVYDAGLPGGAFPPSVGGIWGDAATDVYFGSGGNFSGELVNWNGDAFSDANDAAAGAIWGTGSDIWALWETTVYSRSGGAWSSQTLGSQSLNAVWGSGSDNVWVVGSSGVAYYWDGAAWNSSATGSTSDFFGVWGTDATDLWAVGGAAGQYGQGDVAGTILFYNGTVWTAQASGTTEILRGVWGDGSGDIWAVGDAGTILRWTSGWTSVPDSLTTGNLYAVWGTSAANVYAVGDGGAILHFNGSGWAKENSGTSAGLGAIWGSGPDDIWVGGSGTILRYLK